MKLSDILHRAHLAEAKPEEDVDNETVRGVPPPSSTPAAVGVLTGMAAGAVAGSIAGPPGMIAGAVLGSAIGAAATIALDAQNEEKQRKEEALDRAIGVIGGDLGAASPDQPASSRGAFSAAAMGVAMGPRVELSEGPIPSADEA